MYLTNLVYNIFTPNHYIYVFKKPMQLQELKAEVRKQL